MFQGTIYADPVDYTSMPECIGKYASLSHDGRAATAWWRRGDVCDRFTGCFACDEGFFVAVVGEIGREPRSGKRCQRDGYSGRISQASEWIGKTVWVKALSIL